MRTIGTLWLLLAMAMIGVTACGDDGDPDAANTTTTTARPTSTRCTAPTFSVAYPRPWHVNDADDAAPCRWFHPDPFTLPEAAEAVGIAIGVRYEDGEASALAERGSGDVLDRTVATIDGHEAIRTHRRTAGQGLLPAGTEVVAWFVDLGPRSLLVTTTSDATGGAFEEHADVADEMARSLRFRVDVACSAAGLHVEDEPSASLPTAVADAREGLVDAALACDLDALSRKASEGSRAFTFSFGDPDDAEMFWRDAERRGEHPLRLLVRLLHLRAATPDSGGELFVWPAAHGYDTWTAVPEDHRAALRRVYEPEVVEGFRATDSYLGHRIGIAGDGEWIFFVAGD